jgi:DNA-binding MarR family transcriptional regulator
MNTVGGSRRALRFYAGRGYVAGDSVGYLLHHLAASMRRQVELAMTAHGLTAAQWYPLWKIERDGPCSAQELARDMDIDAGATTRLIDRLAAKGLVERERSAADRRVVMLRLTAAGEAVSACVPQVLADVNNAYLRGFSRDEWQLLKQLLRRMLDNGQALGGTAAVPAAVSAAAPTARRGRR